MRLHRAMLLGLVLGCSSADLDEQADAGHAGSVDVDGGGNTTGGMDGGADAGVDAGMEELCPASTDGDPMAVATHRGAVRGARLGDTVAFLGIPYAAPPVGDLRWKPPEEPACWTETLSTLRYGNQCPQLGPTGLAGDEDCLFLNVWTPSLPDGVASPRPVMFFIHGGAEIMGASNQEVFPGQNLYDGQLLAETQDVVVVTVNYRLGPLGFLAHPALSQESAHGGSGNYATLDLIHALTWVQRNIAGFGGDPANVMVFGESAGALNTCTLIASPLAAGLFHSALMQSGSCVAPPLEDREFAGQQVAVALDCGTAEDVAACLRSKSASDVILETHVDPDLFNVWNLPAGPTVDGYVLPDAPLDIIERGEHNQVPFIIGTNAHETELFLPTVVNTCLDYYALINAAFPNVAEQVLDAYPCLDYLLPRWAAIDVSTDLLFTCPSRRIARAMAQHQQAPVRRYHYRHVQDWGFLTLPRAFHAAELAYVFGTFDAMAYLPTSAEREFSAAIQGYWARFATTHDPNGGDAMAWPTYTADMEQVLALDTELEVVDGIKDDHCDFWDALAR